MFGRRTLLNWQWDLPVKAAAGADSWVCHIRVGIRHAYPQVEHQIHINKENIHEKHTVF